MTERIEDLVGEPACFTLHCGDKGCLVKSRSHLDRRRFEKILGRCKDCSKKGDLNTSSFCSSLHPHWTGFSCATAILSR
eukprot:751727-Hanusia_phi.AAC.5